MGMAQAARVGTALLFVLVPVEFARSIEEIVSLLL
jgi:hypothetical protein